MQGGISALRAKSMTKRSAPFWSSKLQYQMYDLRVPFRAGAEAELPEHFQHCGVLGQHLRDQFFKARITRQNRQMTHENRPDPLALIRVDHDESDLGLAWPDNDIASAAGDSRASVFCYLCDER